MTDPRDVRVVEPGDWVRVRTLPHGLEALPAASRELFQYCLGRTFRVVERDAQGLLVLGLGAAVDARFGAFMNDIRIEPEHVEVVTLPDWGEQRPRGGVPFR